MIYESDQDRDNQNWVEAVLKKKWQCTLTHTHTLAAADFLIHRGGCMKAVAEYKRRQCARFQYRSLTIDESKIDKLVLLSKILHVRALLIIQWNDALCYTSIERTDGLERDIQTRRDIRDQGDIDDRVYHIPVKWFRSIG